MKILRNALVAVVTLLGIATVTVEANLLSISEKEINSYLENKLSEKIPLNDKVGIPGLFELNYNLHSLSTQIGQTEEKKVAISGIVDGLLKVRGKKYDAKISLNLDTIPYYDSQQGAVFLKDIRLLSWSASPEKYQKDLLMFLPILVDGLSEVLSNTPVYTLDESKTKEALVRKFGKAIIIEKGLLRLETSIF